MPAVMNWQIETLNLRSWRPGTESLAGQRLIFSCVALLSALAAAGLTFPLLNLPYHFELDWNEGWNAYWSDTAIRGEMLYPARDAAVTNNYPPVSFYFLGALGRLFGDTVVAGRCLSLVSVLIIATNIGVWLRLSGIAPAICLFAATIFLCLIAIVAPHYLGMNDPQWLGHAFMTTALTLLWRSPDRTGTIVVAGLLMLAGGWIKHLLIPLPLVTTMWMMNRSHRHGRVWISTLLGGTTILFAAAWVFYGDSFFTSLFGSPRHYSVIRIASQAGDLLPLVPVALALLFARVSERGDPATFAFSYLIAAIAISLLASGGAGIDKNRLFDAIIALSLIAGLVCGRNAASPRSPVSPPKWMGQARIAVITGVLVLQMIPALATARRDQEAVADRAVALTRDIALLQTLDVSRAICDTPALCYWAEAPFLLDTFNFGQKLRTASLPVEACTEQMRQQVYSVIVVEDLYTVSRRLTAACNEAILRYYQPATLPSDRVFLVPRP